MKPRVAFFDFSSCEGCQLEAINLTGEELLDLVSAVDIVNFREAKTEREDNYDIAFVEGRVAFGACACIGGVNCLKNHLSMDEVKEIVYGKDAKYYDTIPARPINAVVSVDYYVRGCPPQTAELLKVVKALLLGKKPDIPNHPVCVECKMADNVCVFERGMTCLGPVTRAGCGAICVTSGRFCWGCRGLVDEPNTNSEKSILQKYGLTVDQAVEKFKIYNTYAEVSK
jgi:coenzyme F420-reducing hydrogenase gamma subunit